VSNVPSLARRSVTSVGWNVVSSAVQTTVGLARTVLLARWLPVEVFGVCALAGSIVTLSIVLPDFGMVGAFLHRAPETEHEGEAAAVHFTLRLIFNALWVVLLSGGAFLFAEGQLRLALLVFTFAHGGIYLAQTSHLVLIRRVAHRRVAIFQLTRTLLITVISLYLARSGATLWALLSIEITHLFLALVFFFLWRPVWRPRLGWSRQIVRYFLEYGRSSLLAGVLLRALDQVDDLWAGSFLGTAALGFYSRAYTLATYPRKLLAAAVNAVAGGTYAELKGDRGRLSQAFFRTNALLVRSGFFLAGLMALVAEDLISLLLGDHWLPMLDAFRLMLVFTLLDPIKVTVADLFEAVGRPILVARVRVVQLLILVAGLFLLANRLGITGVALAVDGMLLAGMALLLRQARDYVDYSARDLFAAPLVALAVGLVLSWGISGVVRAPSLDWTAVFIKGPIFSTLFGMVLFVLERRRLLTMALDVVQILAISRRRGPGPALEAD
jgi:O-antigen/teichoic acid export membrane protein